MAVRYDPAVECTGAPAIGLVRLRDYVRARWDTEDADDDGRVEDLGIYNCRPVRGGQTLSLHAEGRAWDARFESRAELEEAMGVMIAHADPLRVQRIIDYANRRIWTTGRGWEKAKPGLVTPGGDAWHIERNRDGAADTRPLEEIIGGAPVEPDTDLGEDAMLPWFSKPIPDGPYRGRWPGFAVNTAATLLVGYNGLGFDGDRSGYGVNVVDLPAGIHGRRLIPDETEDGTGVVILDPTDGGTFFYRYDPHVSKPRADAVDLDGVVDEVIDEIRRRLRG